MARYFLLFIAMMFFSSHAQAQKITQEELIALRDECTTMKNSGAYVSVDHENATERCLKACPESLNIYNNRALTMCMGAHSSFKKSAARAYDAPIGRVEAEIDYGGHKFWAVMDSDNEKFSKHCQSLSLTAAKSHPKPIKGYHMMLAGVKEVPITALETSAILINVRIPTDKTKAQNCTAEAVYVTCPAFRLERPECNR